MAPAPKRKLAAVAQSTRPITAFFERKRPATSAQAASADADASSARHVVEEIDADDEDQLVDGQSEMITVIASPRHSAPRVLNTAHVTRIVQRRELGCSAVMLAHSVPCSSARRRKQQTEQRLARWALTQFRVLPLQLALTKEAQRVVQSHRLASLCNEFYASCLAFDSHGALLVAGSSNGVVALFDCDELFHRTINMQRGGQAVDAEVDPALLPPIHMIFTGLEVQRIQWNPLNEDEIACTFLNRNEIFLYNLQKFPSKPDLVLKASSRPSSGYTDLVFLPPPTTSASTVTTLAAGAIKKKAKVRVGSIIAADIDGAVRAWDLRFPTKPQWTVSTGSQAVTAMTLSHDKCDLFCATEGGVLVTYDVKKLVVPAFGSKPIPPRKSSIRLIDVIMPHLSPEALVVLKHAMRESTSVWAATSLELLPGSRSQVVLQLRNQWLIVLDVFKWSVVKLHTPIKDIPPATRGPSQPLPATVLHSVGNELDPLTRVNASRQRHSWFHHHRCSPGILFHGDMVCSGLMDEDALSVVDLHRIDLLRTKRSFGEATPSRESEEAPDTAERLSRFCVAMPDRVTAVAAHPTQPWILCGGHELKIRVVGIAGGLEDPTRELIGEFGEQPPAET